MLYRIVCRSGNAGSAERSGFVHLKFGAFGAGLSSRQMISYAYPRIDTIEPVIGIESGGTLLTIRGNNLTIGNGHLSIFIGHRPCQLEAVSAMKIECETSSFPPSTLQKPQPIKLFFDRQTQLTSDHSFTVVANPILYSFDRYHQYQTFRSGGHRIVILGENLHFAQQIQLEFQHFLFVSSIFHNSTHLIFLTPPAKELPLNHQAALDLTLYLDDFNRTSSLIYVADPLIYPFEPMLQPYREQLVIQGHNLTAIGHTAQDISVQIGCDVCTVVQLDSDQIICQPPTDRPQKASKSERLCYDSEYPSIVVSIDNIRVHVGDMIYPKKIFIVGEILQGWNVFIDIELRSHLGLVSGCLFTFISCLLLVVLIFYLKNRYVHRRSTRRYFYTNSINPHGNDKEDFYENYSPAERMIFDSTSVPLRSYFNYLQICYYSWDPLFATEDKVDLRSKAELFDQFQFFLEHNQMFIQCLLRNLLKSKNNKKKILIDLILTQRYNLKNLLLLNHDDLHLHICILTFYQNLAINRIRVLFSQLYYQLKLQISQGPVDAIESRYSYYSLNYQSILNNRSLTFKTIQLLVHLYSPELQPITRLHVTCLTCDSISQVKGKILHQLKPFSQVSIDECQLYLFINPSYSSVSSASSSGSSSVPLTRKSLRGEASVHRTMKFSTTLISNESNCLCLHDVDQTNEQTNDGKRLNTLQHYGIINDGYEFRMILPKNLGRTSDPSMFTVLEGSSDNLCSDFREYTEPSVFVVYVQRGKTLPISLVTSCIQFDCFPVGLHSSTALLSSLHAFVRRDRSWLRSVIN